MNGEASSTTKEAPADLFGPYIPYSAVIAIASCNGTTTVTGESASIEHTQYHAATQQFLSLLAKRTGKEIY